MSLWRVCEKEVSEIWGFRCSTCALCSFDSGKGNVLNVFVFVFFFFFSNLKKKKGVVSGVLSVATNWVVTEPWINKNWKLQDWIDKIESERTEMKNGEI